MYSKSILIVCVGCLFGSTNVANALERVILTNGLSTSIPELFAQSKMIVTGKVVELENETVEALPYHGANKDQKIYYRIATIKIQDDLLGAGGLTQVRVGFPADASDLQVSDAAQPLVKRRLGYGIPSVTLTKNQTGCFFLIRHFESDFYLLMPNGGVLIQDDTNPEYSKQLLEIKKGAKILEEPLEALKSKEKNDRWFATTLLIMNYRGNHGNRQYSQKPVPSEINKLLLENLLEMPWLPPLNDNSKSSRSQVWYYVQDAMTGYVTPQHPPAVPGKALPDYNKIVDEATTKYLKENLTKIRLQRFVAQ